VLAQTISITERTDGERLCNALRSVAIPDNPALVAQIIDLERELSALEVQIAAAEAAMNEAFYKLYNLTEREIALVETSRASLKLNRGFLG
jgi:hypothetical protein